MAQEYDESLTSTVCLVFRPMAQEDGKSLTSTVCLVLE